MLKDNESAVIVQQIINTFFRTFTKQEVDKIISDLRNQIESDFLSVTYPQAQE